jgi:hypothetical protein
MPYYFRGLRLSLLQVSPQYYYCPLRWQPQLPYPPAMKPGDPLIRKNPLITYGTGGSTYTGITILEASSRGSEC